MADTAKSIIDVRVEQIPRPAQQDKRDQQGRQHDPLPLQKRDEPHERSRRNERPTDAMPRSPR
jgi:hypothetical protein